eukprot:m.17460 g.17460  ORF g.17460 m.17460 type:complete len:113 (+) comp7459_c0_seq1:869-1207(+)
MLRHSPTAMAMCLLKLTPAACASRCHFKWSETFQLHVPASTVHGDPTRRMIWYIDVQVCTAVYVRSGFVVDPLRNSCKQAVTTLTYTFCFQPLEFIQWQNRIIYCMHAQSAI